MTFTNRAAREIRARLKDELGDQAYKIQAGTFHSFCLKIMSKIPKSFAISGFNIIDPSDQNSLMTTIRKIYINKKDKELNKEFPKAAELIKLLSYSRNTCQNPKDYLDDNSELDESFIAICSKIFADYQTAKEQSGYLDYDDLLEKFTIALSKKHELRNAVTKLFDEVLVDEMQDTNPLQFDILKHFSSTGVRLFCVGDPAQSIYKFRGAEFKHVYKFSEIFGNSTTIPLSLNYRSYQEILDLSNWLLAKSPFDYNNKLTAHRGSGDNLPTLVNFDMVQDEATWIADTIIQRHSNGNSFKSMMILVRSGFDAKPIETELIQKEIPYRFIGGTSLTKTAHVRDLLSLLRVVKDENDHLAWMRFLQLWPRLGEKTAEKIINSFNESPNYKAIDILTDRLGANHNAVVAYRQTAASQLTPPLCVAQAIKVLEPVLSGIYDKWKYRHQDLELLLKVAEKYTIINEFINDFTLEPRTSSEITSHDEDDSVTLITVHGAKGAEAPICFVANAKRGTYPHNRSFGDLDSEEEERRILYVAMTRAQNELFITRSNDFRNGFYFQDEQDTAGEEYFLEKIPEELIEFEDHTWQPDALSEFALLDDIY
jgi:DNA helicase-2/ATP-dependent DNA helicase PcrA